MSDKEFQYLLEGLMAAKNKYFRLLEKAEKEYERRFGFTPDEVVDSEWVAKFHDPGDHDVSVKQVTEAAQRIRPF